MEDETDIRLEKRKNFLINFSYWSVIIIGVFLLLKFIGPILTPFIIAFLISAILNYPVKFISKKIHIRRSFVSIICVIIFYVLSGLVLTLVGARIILCITDIFIGLPDLFTSVFEPMMQNVFDTLEGLTSSLDPTLISFLEDSSDTIMKTLGSFVSKISTGVLGWISGVATSIPGIFLNTLISVIMTFFITISFEDIISFIERQIPGSMKKTINESKKYISTTLFKCILSYAIIILMTFTEIWIGLSILRIDNAMLIAFLIAIFDILPILGTGGIMIPWAIISFIYGKYSIAVGIGILYMIITIIRNIVEPKLVGSQVGLHPVVTLATMLIGLNFFGILGLFGFPITLSLIKNLNDKGVIHIFK